RRQRGLAARDRVLQHEAFARMHIQPVGRLEEDVGCWLALADLARGDYDIEAAVQCMTVEVLLEPGRLLASGESESGSRLLGPVPPVEHPKGAEGVPATRRSHVLDVELDLAGMDLVEEPSAVGLALRSHDVDRLLDAGIRLRTRSAEVVEGAQRVVVPVVGKG